MNTISKKIAAVLIGGVRCADDFVLLAKRWKDGFLRVVSGRESSACRSWLKDDVFSAD